MLFSGADLEFNNGGCPIHLDTLDSPRSAIVREHVNKFYPIVYDDIRDVRLSTGPCRHRGVATGRTRVDISTPLLPEAVPEIDANPVSFYSG